MSKTYDQLLFDNPNVETLTVFRREMALEEDGIQYQVLMLIKSNKDSVADEFGDFLPANPTFSMAIYQCRIDEAPTEFGSLTLRKKTCFAIEDGNDRCDEFLQTLGGDPKVKLLEKLPNFMEHVVYRLAHEDILPEIMVEGDPAELGLLIVDYVRSDGLMCKRVEFGDEPNNNGRVYPRESFEKAMEEYSEKEAKKKAVEMDAEILKMVAKELAPSKSLLTVDYMDLINGMDESSPAEVAKLEKLVSEMTAMLTKSGTSVDEAFKWALKK